MSDLNQQVNEIIAVEKINTNLSLSDKAADLVSEFGGSWAFIFLFTVFCICWVAINVTYYAFDSYPFILLNLILSCLSVFQAPFILMSQNRMSDIDRKRAEEDYKVDLHSELEIIEMHKKIDAIIMHLKL